MAVRGKPIVEPPIPSTVIYGPLRANSQKPDEFYAFVEKLCPASRYAELFARNTRPNWDGHGNDIPRDGYDAQDDINKSVAEGFAAIRERKTAGGPGWGEDFPDMPDFLRREES
jgi:N6-adenosine-specific RNA methylase IME4